MNNAPDNQPHTSKSPTAPDQSHQPHQDLLFMLVMLLAYIVQSSHREVPIEQKAEFITLLRKHVDRGDITESQMHAMVRDAFAQTQVKDFRAYIIEIKPKLSNGQRLSIICNLLDMMHVDGVRTDGEDSIIEQCRRAFNIDAGRMRVMQRIFELKNDTSIFLNPGHPGNDPSFTF